MAANERSVLYSTYRTVNGAKFLAGQGLKTRGGFNTPFPHIQPSEYNALTTKSQSTVGFYINRQSKKIEFAMRQEVPPSSVTEACGYPLATLKRSLIARACLKAQQQWSDDDLSLAVDAAELPETFGMLAKTMSRLANAYKALRGGNALKAVQSLGYSSRRRVPRNSPHVPSEFIGKRVSRHCRSITDRLKNGSLTASNGWLELTYGWKPLIYTAYDYAKVAQRGLSGSRGQFRITGSVSESGSANVSKRYGSVYSLEEEYYFSARAGTVLHINVVHPRVRLLQALGLLNPATVMWELIPFSFVVDWFYPVGDTLSSFSAFAGCEVSGCSSFKVSGYYTGRFKHIEYATPVQCIARCTGEQFSRTLDYKAPRFSAVFLQNKLGTSRLTSAFALLSQSFIKGK